MNIMHTTPLPASPARRPHHRPPTGPQRAARLPRPVTAAAALAVEQLEERRLFAVAGLNDATWTSLGPTTVSGTTLPGTQLAGGRITGIATDPADANTFYVATRGGGIWKTVNDGTTYTTTTDGQPALNIGAIAISASNPDVVYAGTGNGDQDADSTYGQGILRTDNGGATWTLLATSQFARQTVAQIAVDPTDPQTVYAAVQDGQLYGVTATEGTAGDGGAATPPAGIYKSTDGGQTWMDTTAAISTDDSFYDVKISPASPDLLYATFQNSANGQGGVYMSVDGGLDWNITGSFPVLDDDVFIPGDNGSDTSGQTQDTIDGYGRASLAISPTDPSTIYASIASYYSGSPAQPTSDGGAGEILSADQTQGFEAGYVLVSNDAGTTWTQIADVPIFSTHGETDNAIVVSPADPDTFFIGGSPVPDTQLELTVESAPLPVATTTGTNFNAGELYEGSADADTFDDVTLGANGTSGPGANINAFAYEADGTLLVGTDQGVYHLTDATPGAIAWTNVTGNVSDATVRSVSLAASANDAVFTGNAADGSQHLAGQTAVETSAQLDGQYVNDVLVDPDNANVVYQTVADLGTVVEKSTNGGAMFAPANQGIELPAAVSTQAHELVMDPDDPDRLLLGAGEQLYETQDGAATWTEIADFGTDANGNPITVTAMAIGNHGTATAAFPSTRYVYLSTSDGATYAASDDFATVEEIDLPTTNNIESADQTTGETLPLPTVEALAVDPSVSTTAFAVVGGFRTPDELGNSTGSGGHVYMTVDPTGLAATDPRELVATDGAIGDWTDITGNLPNIPVHAIAVLPTGVNGFTRTLFVGTDRGVYVSYDDGGAWSVMGGGLPDAPVYSLALDPATGVLAAGTYGRGVFEISTTFPGVTLTSRVFDDVNVTGLYDASEPGVAGATVQLYTVGADGVAGTADDTLLATTTSTTGGAYRFANLAAGTDYVHVDAPGTYYLGPTYTGPITPAATVSQIDGLVGVAPAATEGSTVNPTTGDSPAFTVPAVGAVAPPALTAVGDAGVYQKTVIVTDPVVTRLTAGDTTATFTVTISPSNAGATTVVPYTTANGSAVAGTDYVATSGTLTFAPGVTTQTVAVAIIPSSTPVLTRTFDLDVTAPAGFVTPDLVNPAQILNGAFPVASIASVSIPRSGLDTVTVGVPVTLDQPAPFATTVDVVTSAGTAGAGTDFNAADYTLYFPAGDTEAIAGFTILPGTDPQVDRTFTVALANPTGSLVLSPDAAAAVGTVTIVSNVLPSFSAAAATVTPAVGGASQLTFTVSLDAVPTAPVTVGYETVNGTAVAGTDYTYTAGTLTFKPGQVSQTVTVPVARRAVAAQTLTLGLALSTASADVTVPATAAVGTIVDTGTAVMTFGGGTSSNSRGGGKRMTYVDSLGQKVTLSISGPGSGQLVYSGASPAVSTATSLLFTGTTAATSIRISVAGRGQTAFDAIEVDGALRSLVAPQVNLTDGTLDVTGGASSITLGYLANDTVTIGGTTGIVALAFNRVVDTSINSTIAIRSLSAGAYVNSSGAAETITAPTVNVRRVKGKLGATVVQTAVA